MGQCCKEVTPRETQVTGLCSESLLQDGSVQRRPGLAL